MILSHHGKNPLLGKSVFIAPSADVIGEVDIGSHSSVWFQVVIRGDVNWIKIGERTNIQDQSVLHVTRKRFPLKVGNEVTVGHRVMLHGCTVGNRVLVGMSATLMDGCEIGDECIVAAGALVTEGKKFPPRTLILGSPARAVRTLTSEELEFLPKSAENYVQDAQEYLRNTPKEYV